MTARLAPIDAQAEAYMQARNRFRRQDAEFVMIELIAAVHDLEVTIGSRATYAFVQKQADYIAAPLLECGG